MRHFFILLFICSIFTACNNRDNDTTITSISEKQKILPIRFSGEQNGEIIVRNFNYVGNKLTNITDKYSKTIFNYNNDLISNIKFLRIDNQREINFTYDNNGNLIKEISVEEEVIGTNTKRKIVTDITYTHNSSTITKNETAKYYTNDSFNGENSSTTVFTLDNDKKIISKVRTSKSEHSSNPDTYKTTTIYSYSPHNPSFKNITGFKNIVYSGFIGLSLSGNIVSEEITQEDSFQNVIVSSSTHKLIYENTFNKDNYPTKTIRYYSENNQKTKKAEVSIDYNK